jgi:hypothetical protein
VKVWRRCEADIASNRGEGSDVCLDQLDGDGTCPSKGKHLESTRPARAQYGDVVRIYQSVAAGAESSSIFERRHWEQQAVLAQLRTQFDLR